MNKHSFREIKDELSNYFKGDSEIRELTESLNRERAFKNTLNRLHNLKMQLDNTLEEQNPSFSNLHYAKKIALDDFIRICNLLIRLNQRLVK